MRCLIQVLTCGCYHFEPFLQVNSVYVLPSQIKEGYKQLQIPLPQLEVTQENLSTLIANIPTSPVQRVETAAEIDRPIRIRILGPTLRLSKEKLTEALFAQRSFSKTQYVYSEPCDAALIIDAMPNRGIDYFSSIAGPLEKHKLQEIPTIFVFVELTNDGPNPNDAGDRSAHGIRDMDKDKPMELPKNCALLYLRASCVKDNPSAYEVNSVDPNSTQQNPWNIDAIKKFHSFIQQHVKK
jgi:hypothetical protein